MSENEFGTQHTDPENMSQEDRDKLELASLRERATIMQLDFHPNTGLKKMRELVNGAIEKGPDTTAEQNAEEVQTINDATEAMAADTFTPMSKPTPQQLQAQRRQEALKLVRIRVSNMNPTTANMKGVIVSVGNRDIGFIKKYVPFNAEQGWHVPKVILTYLQGKKFMTHYEVNDPTRPGKKLKKNRLIPEYGIEILPPLSAKELDELKQRQIIQSGGGNN